MVARASRPEARSCSSGRDASQHQKLLDPAAYGVTSFQVPLYLLAADRALPGRVPAATYLLLGSAEQLTPVTGRPDERYIPTGGRATWNGWRSWATRASSRG